MTTGIAVLKAQLLADEIDLTKAEALSLIAALEAAEGRETGLLALVSKLNSGAELQDLMARNNALLERAEKAERELAQWRHSFPGYVETVEYALSLDRATLQQEKKESA